LCPFFRFLPSTVRRFPVLEVALREFCVKHGKGRKWRFQAKNYSEDLLDDVRGRAFIIDVFPISIDCGTMSPNRTGSIN
jgi:hypothetical protein